MAQEIKLDSIESLDIGSTVSLDADSGLKNVDFGSGVELLMNEKVKNGGTNPDKSFASSNSLKGLENDLNALEDVGIGLGSDINKEIKFEEKNSFQNKPTIEIAKGTSNMEMGKETWDGFQSIDTINIEEEDKFTKKKSQQEVLREKFEVLRKLEQLESKGANLSKKYTMESDLQEMKGEYNHLMNEKEKSNSVKFQGKILTTMITGLEFLNSKFDPFDIKLDGWSEQINENIDDFDEIFSELHEKYKSKAKMAPELKLLFQLASSGIMIHMTNTMFKSALPGMDDIMRQNPDLMNHFTKAAMSSMEQQSPGLSNFMNDFGMSHGQDTNEIKSRPESFENKPQNLPHVQERVRGRPPTPTASASAPRFQEEPSKRPEMKGPSNIDSILSSLGKASNASISKEITLDKSSTISIDDIDNISLSSAASNKRKNKRKSDKNTVSLAI